MKKLLMSACFFICIAAFGQTEKGTWLIGGGLSLNTGQGNGQFSFNPTAGNFVANNFVLGGKINIDYSKQGSIKSFGLGVGPFARYYIGASTTRPFVVTEFGYQNLNTKNTTNNTEIKTDGISFLFGIGFAAFVNKNIAVEGVSGYSYSKFKDTDGSGGFSLRIGFGLYFNRGNVKELKANVLQN